MTDAAPQTPPPEGENPYHDVGCVPLVVLSTRLGLVGLEGLELQLTGGPREILFEGVKAVPAEGVLQELPIEGAPKKPLTEPRVDNDPWVLECLLGAGASLRRILIVVSPDGRITTGTLAPGPAGQDPVPVTRTWDAVGEPLLRYVLGVLTS
jgi:hypothetical protein